jgi:hypothetical protein
VSTEPPIDSLEKKIRLGCGLVAGLVVGFISGFVTLNLAIGPLWAFALTLGVLFAFLAVRYGDRFWGWLLRYW